MQNSTITLRILLVEIIIHFLNDIKYTLHTIILCQS